MILIPIKSEGLAHISYFLGKEGEAAVIDPRRDCQAYLKLAREREMHIRYIFETHRKGLFESIPEHPGMWRLVAWTKTSTEPVPPQYSPLHNIGRLMVKALRREDAGLTALEHYLLAIAAYELNWYRDAMSLLPYLMPLRTGHPKQLRTRGASLSH